MLPSSLRDAARIMVSAWSVVMSPAVASSSALISRMSACKGISANSANSFGTLMMSVRMSAYCLVILVFIFVFWLGLGLRLATGDKLPSRLISRKLFSILFSLFFLALITQGARRVRISPPSSCAWGFPRVLPLFR